MRLELSGLTKRFGSLVANDHIDLTVEPGEIHCLLGENGAGKTTLMNMLYGLLTPDEGTIVFDGTKHELRSPSDAIAAGIGMVHQHFMLVPVFTVAENIVLGREPTRAGVLLDEAAARRRVREVSEQYGLAVDPDRLVEDISVGVRQRVEILKALISGAQVLILDEPTAVLTPQEIDELFRVMRALKADGTSIVFITHKLEEVRAIADTITVIRRGRVIDTVGPEESSARLAELMVGRDVELVVDKEPVPIGGPKLTVENLTVLDDTGHLVVDDVSFQVRGGEVLGIAGVQGNGQSELVEAIIGRVQPISGSVRLQGAVGRGEAALGAGHSAVGRGEAAQGAEHGETELTGLSIRRRLEAGIGFVPEDRSQDGYVDSFSVAENLVLDLYRRPEFSSYGRLSTTAVRENAERRVEEFDVRTQSIDTPVSALSGGNQQKVVVARELSRPVDLLIAGQPTRGLDVGSIEFVHKRILAERANDTAVLLVSTELDEIVALSDRIAVMYGGRIVGIVGPDTPRDQLGLMMAGANVEAAAAEAEQNPTELGERGNADE